jgi:ribonucleoside-diphosphate reductase alpha chain
MLSENAINVFKRLYFRKDSENNYIENTPDEVFARVSKVVAGDNTELQQKFYTMMQENYFRPNSPCMMNVGVRKNPQTSACFVGSLEDDLISILDLEYESGIIFSHGSGIGINWGILREKDAFLSKGGASSGPIAHMHTWGTLAEDIRSGGTLRRSAEMAMFFDNHPDLLEFITLKDGRKSVFSSMNLSVAISDRFMKAVNNNEMWDLIGVVDGKVKSTYNARDIFNLIAENAHKTGDPGVWFIDETNRFNGLIKQYGLITSTNPCGEEPLLPRQSCNLLSINLSKFIESDEYKCKDLSKHFNWNKFEEVVKYATIFLDNMIDISGYPTPEYEVMSKDTRHIGLGIMGLADVLCILGISYDSNEAYKFAETITRRMTKKSIETSIEIAREKGSFPSLENNREGMTKLCSKFGVMLGENTPLRNSNWTTIAPTGSISISCDCSPGMEPHFGICYTKNLKDTNEKWIFINPIFKKNYKNESWYEEAIKKIAENHGSCQEVDCVPENVKKIWKVAHDIHWKDRIAIQSSLQSGISSGISSTINLPSTATVDEIKAIYKMAWEEGLKGITVYRDGSLNSQPVEFKQGKQEKPKRKSRPQIRDAKVYTVETGHGSIHITITWNGDGEFIELFTAGGKGGGVNAAQLEAIGRLISLNLQANVEMADIAKQLAGISDNSVAWSKLHPDDKKTVPILSIPDAVGKLLYRFYVKDGCSVLPTATSATISPDEIEEEAEEENTLICPECGGPASMKEGCLYCPECGSRCG